MSRPRRGVPHDAGEARGGEHVEGRRAVRELLSARRRRVRSVTLAIGAEGLDEIVALAEAARVPLRSAPPERLRALARTDAPQGVVARADPVPPADPDDLLARPDALVLALDSVTDPGNVGAILRSAESAGATGVVLPHRRAAGLTPAAVKAAAGAVEHVPIATVPGVPAFLERARKAGLWIVGLDPTGDTDIFTLPIAERALVLVLGSEGSGLSRLARARCDVLATIPMRGRIASLNVAAAAAVACFEIARQRAQ